MSTTIGFDAISPSQVLLANVVGSGTTYTVENEIQLIGSAGLTFRNNGDVLFGQGGVSTAGFGVEGGPSGVASSRGIDGGESMTIDAVSGSGVITNATLTIGLNNGTQNQLVEWAVDVFNGTQKLTTLTGSFQNDGSVNDLINIPVTLPGATFDKLVLKNSAVSGEPFALSKVSLDIADVTTVGFDAIGDKVKVADVVGSGTTYTVEGEVKLTGSSGLSFRNNGDVLFGQGGVSTAGFGVQGGPNGVASSRGIDGGESMTIEAFDGDPITNAKLTIGLNNGTQNQLVEWAVDVFNDSVFLTTVTGSFLNDGFVNDLIDINVSLGGGATFDKMVLKNSAGIGEPFALSKVSLDIVDLTPPVV
jgi:hypothetical protein